MSLKQSRPEGQNKFTASRHGCRSELSAHCAPDSSTSAALPPLPLKKQERSAQQLQTTERLKNYSTFLAPRSSISSLPLPFYDLEDPVHFSRGIREDLASDDLWIFEMPYMPSMLEANSHDTICNKHLEYYSLAVIENVLRRADFKALRATFNSINGGSIRVYPTHATNFKFKNPAYVEQLRKLRQQEFDSSLIQMNSRITISCWRAD
jgi:hypothetical protein